ncbi:MAG: NDP-sugar synthase [Acidobacteria bacterium]|jgi:NDP-sugar pyrophosphorylase family protein|nr:NDP-sugar synthase [Acidobacteriota bacterium]
MKYFILAGGYGKRAEPLSRCKPKPAFPLGGVPLIALLLDQLRALGCAAGFVNLHHLGDQVVAAAGDGGGVRFIREERLSGSRVLSQALPFFSRQLLALNGDTYLEIPLAELQRRAADPRLDGVLLARSDRSGRYARLICAGDDFQESAAPAPAGQEALMYAGAALFKRSAVAKIDEDNFFASIRRHRLRFQVVRYDGIWLDIGTPASYFQANWEYMAHRAQTGGNALSPGVTISPAARVQRSVLWEDTRVGPGASLDSCIVTNGVELGDAAHSGRIVTPGGTFPLF